MRRITSFLLGSTALAISMSFLPLADAHAAEQKLVPYGYDFEQKTSTPKLIPMVECNQGFAYRQITQGVQIEEIVEEESEAPAKSWWNTIKDGGYNFGLGLVDLGYAAGNTAYTVGMTVKGTAEVGFGASEYIYGAAHNFYGTLRGYDAEFMEIGTNWSNVGWDKMTLGANDMKAGVYNLPNMSTHYVNGLYNVASGSSELMDGIAGGAHTLNQYLRS